MIFEMKNIRKAFGQTEVLKDISMHVDSGEVVSIIGPSGSGKSTLLRCGTFLEQIDGGEIRYMDQTAIAAGDGGPDPYADKAKLEKNRQYFGLVFQQFNLFPHFSVMKNVTDAPIRVQKRPKEQVMEEAKELLRKMGLSERADAYPCQLSGGQQQRVAIARALALKPSMLFFDEPTSALDPELEYEVLSIIRQLCAEKQTIVIITHKLSFAQEVADKIVFFDGGKILCQGTWEEMNDGSVPRIAQFLNMLR